MSANPPPRPALAQGSHGEVTPASARVAHADAPIAVEASTRRTGKKDRSRPDDDRGGRVGGKKGKKGRKEPTRAPGGGSSTLTVTVPKDLRKQARRKADETGIPLDDVVAALIAGWVGR